MKNLLISITCGVVMSIFVTVAGALVGAFTDPATFSELEHHASSLSLSLYIWFALAIAWMAMSFRSITVSVGSFVLRMIFLWGPINLGWYLLASRGNISLFQLGLVLSSIVFCYQVRVWNAKQKAGSS